MTKKTIRRRSGPRALMRIRDASDETVKAAVFQVWNGPAWKILAIADDRSLALYVYSADLFRRLEAENEVIAVYDNAATWKSIQEDIGFGLDQLRHYDLLRRQFVTGYQLAIGATE